MRYFHECACIQKLALKLQYFCKCELNNDYNNYPKLNKKQH